MIEFLLGVFMVPLIARTVTACQARPEALSGGVRSSIRRAVPTLIEKGKRGNEPELRGIVEALGRLGDPRVTPFLAGLLETGKEDVRHAAAVAHDRIREITTRPLRSQI